MRSTLRRASLFIVLVGLAACSQKKTLVPFVIPLTPTDIVTGKTAIFYSTFDTQGQAVRTAFEVSKDGGHSFVPATPANGEPAQAIVVAHPDGAPNFFYWDSFADLGPGVFTKVVIRATGFAQGATGRQAETLEFTANESGSFTPTSGNPGAARSLPFAAPLPDGSVLLAGGLQGAQPSALVEVYDPATEKVQGAGSLTHGRSGVGGALLSSGQVLLAGGADSSNGALADAEVFSRATNAATPVAGGLVVARADAAVGALEDGTAVVAGGVDASGAPVARVELYNPDASATGGFAVVTSSALAAVRGPTATTLEDGRVLFTGGADANGQAVAATFLYDPATRAISAGPSMSNGRVGHRATRLVSGQVLVAGGRARLSDASSAASTAELYDPATNTWRPVAGLNRARAFFGLDLAGGRVVAVGGSGPASDVATTGETYDVDANTWTLLAFAPVFARSDAVVVTSGPGRALVAGGGMPPEIYHPLDATRTLQIINTANGEPLPNPPAGQNPSTLPPPIVPITPPVVSEAWLALRAPVQPRAFHTATRLSTGDVLLVGGTSGVSTATTSCELFEIAPLFTGSDTVVPRASLTTARAHHAAAFLFSGEVLAAGGVGADGRVLGSMERYDFLLDTWTPSAATLVHPRYDHHAFELPNGDILILGGRDQTGAPVGQAELYHPSQDTIEAIGSELTPRADDDEIETPQGQLLIAGGRDKNGVAVKTLEVFDLFAHTFTQAGSLLEGRAGLALADSADPFSLIATGGVSGVDGTAALADYEGVDTRGSTPQSSAGGPQPLDSPRSFHKASVYNDRVVLLAGGETGGRVLDTSSLYVPVLDFVPPTTPFGATVRPPLNPRMNMPRVGFTQTPLEDGRVLVTGGFDHRGVVVPGLEVFQR